MSTANKAKVPLDGGRRARARLIGVALFLSVLAGMDLSAHAFFPLGGFDVYNRLTFVKWSQASLNDANHDGDISGPNEGIKILLAGGPNGFTDDEIQIVKDSFQVWQDVPTAAVGFQFIGETEDPLLPVVDLVNYVTIVNLGQAGLAAGILAQTLVTYIVDDSQYTFDGVGLSFTGGQIVEADIVVNGSAVRSLTPGVAPVADLKATLVHEVGHFIGLEHTPLNNVEIVTSTGIPFVSYDGTVISQTGILAESQVIALRDATGVLAPTGATPSMFPFYFLTDDGAGSYKPGSADLAPDDVAGVSFLYPRGSQDVFFSLSQEARTLSTNPNLPTLPIAGAHIVAWCDADNDPNTTRVPLFSTVSGLYQYQPLLGGEFTIYNLYKQMETVGGSGPFAATYTFTLNELNGLAFDRQAPLGTTVADFASITGGVPLDTAVPPYTSETYNESGDLYDIADHDVGTPLYFDDARGMIVSATSGKTLDTILPGTMPMFGDQNGVCPLNFIYTGTPTTTTTAMLRGFRDDFLLKTSVGTAMVDTYYSAAPRVARFLIKHAGVLAAAQTVGRGVDWVLVHGVSVLTGAMGVAAVMIGFFLRKKFWLAAGLVMVAWFCMPSAHALIEYLTDDQMVQLSDDIVQGTVASVNSLWVTQSSGSDAMFTDIAITVSDTMKGSQNKSAQIFLRIPGGRIGEIVTHASEMPDFTVGEEVLLYLQHTDSGLLIVAGKRGKFNVVANAATGQKQITASSAEAQLSLKTSAIAKSAAPMATKPNAKASDTAISLERYKDYVRTMVKSQKQKKN